MTLPTLHKPQKDSPETYLAAGINDLVTTLTLNDSSIFQAAFGDHSLITVRRNMTVDIDDYEHD